MVQNGPEWHGIVQNESDLLRIARAGPEWLRIVWNEWLRMDQNRSEWLREWNGIVQNASEWVGMAQHGLELLRMVHNSTESHRMAQNCDTLSSWDSIMYICQIL